MTYTENPNNPTERPRGVLSPSSASTFPAWGPSFEPAPASAALVTAGITSLIVVLTVGVFVLSGKIDRLGAEVAQLHAEHDEAPACAP